MPTLLSLAFFQHSNSAARSSPRGSYWERVGGQSRTGRPARCRKRREAGWSGSNGTFRANSSVATRIRRASPREYGRCEQSPARRRISVTISWLSRLYFETIGLRGQHRFLARRTNSRRKAVEQMSKPFESRVLCECMLCRRTQPGLRVQPASHAPIFLLFRSANC